MLRQKQNTKERRGETMQTDCISKQFSFQDMEQRKVVSAFDGGHITSDAGAAPLGEKLNLVSSSSRGLHHVSSTCESLASSNTVWRNSSRNVPMGCACGNEDRTLITTCCVPIPFWRCCAVSRMWKASIEGKHAIAVKLLPERVPSIRCRLLAAF